MKKKLDEQGMRSLLEAGYETRNLEYKPPLTWAKDKDVVWLKEIIIRAILAMTNTRFGGQIVLGVEEDKTTKTINLKGLTNSQVNSFNDFDGIKGSVDKFSFSDTNFDLYLGEFNSKKYIVISVQEFYRIPAICKKNGASVNSPLHQYDIYSRSKKAPYGSIRATEHELREIIEMAVDKEKENFHSRGWTRKGKNKPENYYNQQIKDLL